MSSCTPTTTTKAAVPTGRKPNAAQDYIPLRLINPHEYAIAERMYGADSYLIACELDVTVQVIEDYKNWLHENVTN